MPVEPAHANGDSRAFWEGTSRGELLLQRCAACGSFQFPPRHHCATCWDGDLEWIASAGDGQVESFTIVRRAPLPAFRDRVPYVVVAVRLDEGPRMIAELAGAAALDVSIGDAVRVDFPPSKEGEVLPRFRRA